MNHGLKFLFFVVTVISFSACSDEAAEEAIVMDDIVVITVDDAAELVAASMALATYGAVDNMNYVSDQIVDLLDCDEMQSDTRTDTEVSNNGNVTVSYTISESYSLTCQGDQETIAYNFSADQTTTSDPRDTDHFIEGDWIIDGAEDSSTTLTYNGTYSRGGTWTYNYEENHVDNATSVFGYSDVKANKDDGVIFEGTSTFELDGTSTVYEPYSYEGDIVFQSDNICVATFSSGEQYEINLNTGDVTPL